MIRVGLAVAMAAACAGCFGADSKLCSGADGVDVLCPASATCVLVGSAAACQSPDFPVCGDGVVGSGEVCDDGNTVSGDGCSADCKSDETCGNGIVDTAAGEQCDDHNLRSHDGCDSTCSPELAHWIERSADDLLGPKGRISAAAAYDARHGEVVLFGGAVEVGTEDEAQGDTWLWAGSWHQVLPFNSPTPRSSHVLAYDGADGHTYLFGGLDAASTVLGDLWSWDGNVWHNVQLAEEPPARSQAAMAYDAHRRRLVLYGGIDATNHGLGDTWELDVTTAPPTWTLIAPGAHDPGARAAHTMAYDALHDNIVMFGGDLVSGTGTTALADTWTYDATGWSPRTPVTVPPACDTGEMGFDGTQVVLSVGQPAPPPAAANYAWDGSDWRALAAATTRPGAAIAFVPPAQLLLFGGDDLVVHAGVTGDAVPTMQGYSAETDLWPAGGSAGSGAADFVSISPIQTPRVAEAAVLNQGLGAPVMLGGLGSPPVGSTAPSLTRPA